MLGACYSAYFGEGPPGGVPIQPTATLGVPRGATAKEIRIAYRDKCLLLHPDRTAAPSRGSSAAFLAVQEAYETLKDDLRRREHDASLTARARRPRYDPELDSPEPAPSRPNGPALSSLSTAALGVIADAALLAADGEETTSPFALPQQSGFVLLLTHPPGAADSFSPGAIATLSDAARPSSGGGASGASGGVGISGVGSGGGCGGGGCRGGGVLRVIGHSFLTLPSGCAPAREAPLHGVACRIGAPSGSAPPLAVFVLSELPVHALMLVRGHWLLVHSGVTKHKVHALMLERLRGYCEGWCEEQVTRAYKRIHIFRAFRLRSHTPPSCAMPSCAMRPFSLPPCVWPRRPRQGRAYH